MTSEMTDTDPTIHEFESTTAERAVSGSPTPRLDPAYEDVLRVAYAVSEVLLGIQERRETADAPTDVVLVGPSVADLEAAFRAAQRLRTHDDADVFKRHMAECPPGLLEELHATVVEVAPRLGLDVDLPDPDVDPDGPAAVSGGDA